MRTQIWFDHSRRGRGFKVGAVAAAVAAVMSVAWVSASGDDEPGAAASAAGPAGSAPVADGGRITVSRLPGPASLPPRRSRGDVNAASGAAMALPAQPGAVSLADQARESATQGAGAARARRVATSAPLRNEREPDAPDEPAPYWKPRPSDTWHMQFVGPVRAQAGVQVYVVDLFDFPQADLQQLQAAGRRVVCLFSAGSAESWRPDYVRFLPHELGAPVAHGPDERWVDTRSANVRAIMESRLDHAVARGCDAVGLGAVDGYANEPGLALNAVTQLEFNRFMASRARSKGLAVGLMNDVEQVVQLAAHFDFAINAQCHEYEECLDYAAFVAEHKPVFNVEHDGRYVVDAAARASLCAESRAAQLRTLVLPQALDGSFRYSCDAEID